MEQNYSFSFEKISTFVENYPPLLKNVKADLALNIFNFV